jgi:hypothetical protein
MYKPLILPSHTTQHNLHPSSSWLQKPFSFPPLPFWPKTFGYLLKELLSFVPSLVDQMLLYNI